MNTLTLSTSTAATLSPQSFSEKKKLSSKIIGRLEFCETSLQAELNQVSEKHWVSADGSYEMGSWKSCVLAARENKRGPAQPTPAGKRLKSIMSVLEKSIGWERVQSVRLLCSGANGLVLPHRQTGKGLCLQIPLVTDEMCLNSEDTHVFHMRKFEVWWMDGARVHAAGSFGFIGRLQLEVICDEGTSLLLESNSSHEVPLVFKKPVLTRAKEKVFLDAAREKIKSDVNQALKILTQVQFYYKVDAAQAYEWLEYLAYELGQSRVIATVSQIRRRFLA